MSKPSITAKVIKNRYSENTTAIVITIDGYEYGFNAQGVDNPQWLCDVLKRQFVDVHNKAVEKTKKEITAAHATFIDTMTYNYTNDHLELKS